MPKKILNVVTLGGGGGHAQLLIALQKIPGLAITAICTAFDTGGSTGRLAANYSHLGIGGWLGDAGRCIAALTPNSTLASALLYRFDRGCLDGHSLKNLLLAGLAANNADPTAALETMRWLCRLGLHRVRPITLQRATLKVRMGRVTISGENYIDTVARNPFWDPRIHPIGRAWLSPAVDINPTAANSIGQAKWIIIAPGDLFTSVLPVLLVRGLAEAIPADCQIVMVLNLMTKIGETDRYCMGDFLTRVEQQLKRPVNMIIANNKHVPHDILARYQYREHKVAVIASDETPLHGRQLFTGPLWTTNDYGHIVHQPVLLRRILMEVLRIRL